MFPPERIVCLTEETVETLYLLGEDSRIVGISGYVVRPPRARREKPRVSAFTTADVPKILDLKPDLVLTFSASPPCLLRGRPKVVCRSNPPARVGPSLRRFRGATLQPRQRGASQHREITARCLLAKRQILSLLLFGTIR